MNLCDRIQERLVEDGVAIADGDAEVRQHLDSCPACTRVLDDLRQLDAALRDLPEHDAPDELVSRTLDAVRRAGQEPARPAPRHRMVAGSLAASVVLMVSLGLTFSLWRPDPMGTADELDIFSRTGESERYHLAPPPKKSKLVDELARDRSNAPRPPATEPSASVEESSGFLRGLLSGVPSKDGIEKQRSDGAGRKEQERFGQSPPAPRAPAADAQGLARQRLRNELEILARLGDRRADDTVSEWERGSTATGREGAASEAGQRRQNAPPGSLASALGDELNVDTGSQGRMIHPKSILEDQDEGRKRARERSELSVDGNAGPLTDAPALPGQDLFEDRDFGDNMPTGARERAVDFLRRYRATEGVTLRGASGYWSNSYIPGDPAMRHLQARLRDWKRKATVASMKLEQDVHPLQQPFDAPRDAALAVYLDADTPAITQPTRLRVQVGLKGAERQGGRRSAMNVGLVVDLRTPPTPEMAARIRALIFALSRARQPADRFSLIVAGRQGRLRVPAEDFRHGPLLVAMDSMFDGPGGGSSPASDLPQALAQARGDVLQGHDADGVLGSSLLLLVTGSSIAAELDALERLAHDGALHGIPLSVVTLGGSSDLQQVNRLVAAGQGNRRILATAREADALVDRELHASSRAVARALRLRIRLHQGVSLINVLGSAPLAATDVARVRQAEKAIDRRVARNLGIQADRGEDEEGIQIIIPSFHAGDSHVILLDVLAQRPGPIADVTVRYKDVIYLRNGVAQASLTVDDDPAVASPRQQNVLKNLVAFELAREMRSVSRQLVRGELAAALIRLSGLRDLLQGLRLEVGGWIHDSDLDDDVHRIETYLAALDTATGTGTDSTQRLYIADSLRYAAFRKLQALAD